MKRPSALLWIGATLGLVWNSAYAAERLVVLKPDDLATRCQQQAMQFQDAKSKELSSSDFELDHDAAEIKQIYGITVLRLNHRFTSTLKVVGLIDRTAVSDAEIPVITAICLNGNVHLASTGNAADIDITSNQGDAIPVRFHLNNTHGDSGLLKHTTWQATGILSLWMTGPFAEGQQHNPPAPGERPECLKSTPVSVSGPDLSFDFDLCANQTGAPVKEYEYSLHLKQKSGSASIDIAIDPLIINRPPS